MRYPVMLSRCKTCIFRPRGLQLGPGRLDEIRAYLPAGTPHQCHSVESSHCRGGRDFQLEIWSAMGLIPEASDEALDEVMGRLGLG